MTDWYGRIGTACLGLLAGLIYGVILAGAAFLIVGGPFSGTIIFWAALVSMIIGFIWGNLVGEALLALMHFLMGLASGLDEHDRMPLPDATGYLRVIGILGFVAGLALGFAYYW
ncbi:hypothetical protein [Chitinivorax sp. B]|uniref:hypothetical protein n=1 Tax=Chitinivorax sp. B TaxID=2502235 RepID=UPI0010F58DEF|nr:hypothetical protein [Chitinivorax sp. B]